MRIPGSATATDSRAGTVNAVTDAAGPSVLVPRLADLARDGVPRHIVIALFNAMGDAFLALPVIRHVSACFGPDRVSVWANDYHGKTVYAELGDVFIPSAESNLNSAADRKAEELAALRCRLPPGRALSWVSLNPYAPRTVVEDHAIAGLGPQTLWEFRDARLRIDQATGAVLHRVDQYFRVIGERATPPVDGRPWIDNVFRQRAAAVRDQVHRMSKRLVGVHAQTRGYKCWPPSHWHQLGRALRDECEMVVLGGPAQPLSDTEAYLTAPQGWHKQVAILAHADAFVGIDSCFSHVADAFNVPGVVLYGDAVAAAQWRPKGPALRALIAPDGDLASLAPAEVAGRIRSCLATARGAARVAAGAAVQ
jgi:hypothetical protein